jgi:pyruvate ferredoxin oxidoreductase gamma subunit
LYFAYFVKSMKYHKDIFEVIFHARGGQGAKTAAEILAQAALAQDLYVQAFPSFGPERSGAPTKTYLRISDNPIRTKEPVIDPDVVVVLDETLLDSQNVILNLDKNEALIINTTKSQSEIKEKIAKISGPFEGKIYAVDASGISLEIIGQPRPNTVILGKFVQVTEAVKLESVLEEFRKIFEAKIGHEACEKNIMAIEKAYDTI